MLLDRSSLLRDLTTAEKVWIVPALYHLTTGKVQFFRPITAVPSAQTPH